MAQIKGYVTNQEWQMFTKFYELGNGIYFDASNNQNWPEVIDYSEEWPEVIEIKLPYPKELADISVTLVLCKNESPESNNQILLDSEYVYTADFFEDEDSYQVTLRGEKFFTHMYQ